MALFLFWFCVLAIAYTYIIFPLLLHWLARRRPAPQQPQTPDNWPSLAIIVAAYNEESCIGQRLDNLLQQDYPGEFHILVGSDGSKDNTASILQRYADHPQISVCIFEQNRGKVSVLNDLVAQAAAEILVFTDANTQFAPDTLTRLATAFTRPDIGAVSGELILTTPDGNQNADGLYWRYEQQLKKAESRLDSLLGANGAIYAMRRSLYQPLPTDTIVDDFCIVMNVRKQGYRVIYDDRALAYEEVAPSLKDEFGRRVRIGLGNYKALLANSWALHPRHGLFAWCFWSHKVLRWLVPHFMLLALLANLWLLEWPFYQLTLALQLLAYGLVWWGQKRLAEGKKIPAVVALLSFFVMMNLALGVGFIRFIRGHNKGSWQRTSRQGESS